MKFICRVFDIDGDTPEFYVLEGDLDILLTVEPVTYRARGDGVSDRWHQRQG